MPTPTVEWSRRPRLQPMRVDHLHLLRTIDRRAALLPAMRFRRGTESPMELPLQHQLARLDRRVQESGLDRDGALQRLLRSINRRYPTAGDHHVLQVVEQRLALLELGVGDRGFHPLRPGVLTGPYVLGTDIASGVAVRAQPSHLARTTIISGATGTGKTTLLHHIVEQALREGVKVWTIDAKDDSQQLAVSNERTLVIDAHSPLNLLQRPSFLSKSEHQAIFSNLFARAFFGGEHLKQVVTRAFEQLDDHGTFEDLAANIERGVTKNATYAERDAIRGALQRAHRVKQLYPGLYQTKHGARIEDLCEHPFCFPIKIQTEVDEFIFSYLIHLLFLYQRSRATRPVLSHLIQMDEGMLSWNRNASSKIEGVPLLSYLQSMIREFGIGMLISTTSIHLLDPLLKSNTFLRIALNVTDHVEGTEVARTFGLNEQQREDFHRGLTRGEEIIKFADEWTDPILATYPARSQRKAATLAEWEAAKRRITALIPAPPSPIIITAAAREENTGWTPPSQAPAATASRGQATRATDSTAASVTTSSAQERLPQLSPNASQETSPNATEKVVSPNQAHRLVEDFGIASNSSERRTSPNASRPRVALGEHARALLQDVADHPFTLCTKAYRRCELLLAQGDRARAQLERLALLRATRVTCGRGRGKSGIALSLRPDAWRVLGRPRGKGLRGGSSAGHSHCVFELSRRIPDSTIEEYLGSKPIDLCIPFNTATHELFYRAITLLTGKTPHLEDGDIIAVEVEISAPRSVRNAVKNTALGVALTILAVADREPERLDLNLPPNAIVLDVYALLDTLRPTEEL